MRNLGLVSLSVLMVGSLMASSAAVAQTNSDFEDLSNASRSAQDLGPQQVRTLTVEDLSVGGEAPLPEADVDFFDAPTETRFVYSDSLPLSGVYSVPGRSTCNDPKRVELLCDDLDL
ncbi:MAG: hypothetical protein AAF152_06620 [Cyanobacteria bacterium P01_A01_bin.114]